jgi:hypothetical protein
MARHPVERSQRQVRRGGIGNLRGPAAVAAARAAVAVAWDMAASALLPSPLSFQRKSHHDMAHTGRWPGTSACTPA